MMKKLVCTLIGLCCILEAAVTNTELKEIIAHEEQLLGVTLYCNNSIVEKLYGVRLSKNIQQESDLHTSKQGCVKAETYYIVFSSNLTSNFEKLTSISFHQFKPQHIECKRSKKRTLAQTYLGLDRNRIIELLGTPNQTSKEKSRLQYELFDISQGKEEHLGIEFTLENNFVRKYMIFKGIE